MSEATTANETSGSSVSNNSRQKTQTLKLSLVDDGGYLTTDEAGLAAMRYSETQYQATGPNQEVTGLLMKSSSNDRYYFTEGGSVSANFRAKISVVVPDSLSGDFSYAGDYHTHPYTRGISQEGFSTGDNVRGASYPRYLRTPMGDARVLRSFNGNTIDGTASGVSICPTANCLPKHVGAP